MAEGDRIWWYVTQCPADPKCSAASFKKAGCWSYDDPEGALERLKTHLMTSSYHLMSADDAATACVCALLQDEVETAEQRAAAEAAEEPSPRAPAASTDRVSMNR